MKILVTAKRVEDPESRIRVRPDGGGIQTEGLDYRINPFDEVAIEEGLRLCAAHGGELTVVTVGPESAQAELRRALSMGAQRGIFVRHDGPLDSDLAARLLEAVARRERPDLVLLGKQAVDDDQGLAGQLLAARLGWGQITFATKLDSLTSEAEKRRAPGIEIAGTAARAWREVEGGVERLEVELPAVVTVGLRLCKPRLASLMGIRKARGLPLEVLTPVELGVDTAVKVRLLSLAVPASRKPGERVADVATLVRKLRDEARVL